MKKLGLALLAAAALTACSFDRTLDSLVPGNAYGVMVVEHPALTAQVLGQTADLPWADLDGGKPWAAAVLPGSPPVVFVALALADKPAAWSNIEAWARNKAGLAAARAGTYAVLTSGPVPPSRFDLTRVRTGDLVSVYLDVNNLLSAADQFPFLKAGPAASFIGQNLAGVHLGFAAKDGGVAVTATTDLRTDAAARPLLKSLAKPAELAKWTGLFPQGDGLRLAAILPPELVTAASGWWNDPSWAARWSALAPLLGPGLAVSVSPRADGTWSWTAAVGTKDPQAVRQALKTMVAGGDLQRNFASWSIDADTPLIYQDKPDAAGLRTQLTFGTETIQLAWGEDRVALAGGTGAADALGPWKTAAASPVSWFGQVPSGASVAAEGLIDGLGARGSVRVLADGNVELSVWTGAAGLKAWEARGPQALLGSLGGAADSKP